MSTRDERGVAADLLTNSRGYQLTVHGLGSGRLSMGDWWFLIAGIGDNIVLDLLTVKVLTHRLMGAFEV